MQFKKNEAIIAVAMLGLLSACSSSPVKDLNDPYENWNRKVQSFNDDIDGYVLKPVAEGYKWVMPDFANQGVSNFFNNVEDIGVIANSALQGNFSQTGGNSARFLINTTAGIGGMFDVATLIDLPKHENSFDNTLAFWGVDTGPYLVLPILGPSSVRGIGGLVGDMAFNPSAYISMPIAVSAGLGITNAIDKRSDNLAMEKIVSEATIDRYEFFKNIYLTQHKGVVKIGDIQNEDPLKFNERDKNNH